MIYIVACREMSAIQMQDIIYHECSHGAQYVPIGTTNMRIDKIETIYTVVWTEMNIYHLHVH